ncbi:MAG: tetratricopeptide repeat protein, partial [Pirellulaceae bacterium]
MALVLGVSGSLIGCKSPVGGQTAANYHSGTAPAPTNPITKAWKSTSDSVASVFSPKPATPPVLSPENDPTSLSSKTKVSASTYIATGRLLESRQEFVKAQSEYEKAIQAEPKNLTALVSLARLQDRQGNPDQAIVTYQKAVKAHPKSALVHNDFGLCYARKRDLASAVAMLHKAVEMEPSKPNYRNNLATVLVEAGRTDDALKHLRAVHAPAAAHYNLAYLLNHRGQGDLARRHLMQAVQLDPSFAPAQEM